MNSYVTIHKRALRRSGLGLAVTTFAATILGGAALAQTPPALRTELPQALAERINKEAEARESCKRAICESHRKKAAAPLACKVVKTWPAVDLKERILKGAMDWSWGHAQCTADLDLDPAEIAKVAGTPKLVMKVAKHAVSCNLEKEDGKETHKLTFSIAPEVTFENGKAVKAVLHWADVDGTTLAKTALWSATAVDNTFNVLQGVLIGQINEFFGAKCDEMVK